MGGINLLYDSCKYFVDSARGIYNGEVELFGDFRIGGVDFLLEFVGLCFEGFGSFTAVGLTVKANLIRYSQDETEVRVDVFVGKHFFGETNDFATRDTFAVTLIGESGPVVASGNDDAALAQDWFGDFVPKFDAGGSK